MKNDGGIKVLVMMITVMVLLLVFVNNGVVVVEARMEMRCYRKCYSRYCQSRGEKLRAVCAGFCLKKCSASAAETQLQDCTLPCGNFMCTNSTTNTTAADVDHEVKACLDSCRGLCNQDKN